MRKNVSPSTSRQSIRNNDPYVFKSFGGGTIQDVPASLDSGALADSINLTMFPGYYEGRTGNKLFTETRLPTILSGLIAHKSGLNIVSDSGAIFTPDMVGSFWSWGNVTDFIIQYIDAYTVRTESSVFFSGVNCSIIGLLSAFFWHNKLKKWILFIGKNFYFSDWDIPSWKSVFTVSVDQPQAVRGDHFEYNDYTYLFNSSGLYKLETATSFPIAYRVNLDPPDVRIKDQPALSTFFKFRYNYLYSCQRLQADGGIVNRQTPSVISLETGTNIPDSTGIDYAEVNTAYPITRSTPAVIGTMWIPKVAGSNPVQYQQHLDNFSIWRTMDLESKDINDVNKEKFNDPNGYVWVKDLRICAAFFGKLGTNIYGNTFTLYRGEYEQDDIGSILELDNGERFEISNIFGNVAWLENSYYQTTHLGDHAAAIGNGRVMRGDVDNGVLTRTAGGKFSVDDLRKTIRNSDGYRLYVTEFLNENQVRVHLNQTLPEQGFTLDPTHRNYNDYVDDDTLAARQKFYSCYSRYKVALPNGNMGGLMPGFVIVGTRGQTKFYYSNLIPEQDYMIGNYVTIQLVDGIKDILEMFWVFGNVMAVICATSTYNVQVGLSEFTTLPGSNESLALLPGITLVDAHTGCVDIGSVSDVENGAIALITNEPGGECGRMFDGTTYSTDNFLVDSSRGGRIERALRATKRMSTAIYDGFMGYILWRKKS